MRGWIFSGFQFACLTAASCFAAEVLMEDPLFSLGAWQAKPPEAVSVDNGAAKIVFTVEAKGENIQTGREVYCCGKIQVVCLKANSKQPTFAAERVFDLDEPMLKVSTFQGDCEVPPYSISRILLHFED